MLIIFTVNSQFLKQVHSTNRLSNFNFTEVVEISILLDYSIVLDQIATGYSIKCFRTEDFRFF